MIKNYEILFSYIIITVMSNKNYNEKLFIQSWLQSLYLSLVLMIFFLFLKNNQYVYYIGSLFM